MKHKLLINFYFNQFFLNLSYKIIFPRFLYYVNYAISYLYLSNKLNLEFPTITLDLGVTCSDALTLDLGVTGSDAKLRLLNNIPFYLFEYF